MPVYEFHCADCGDARDLLLPLGETAPRPCPACGGTARHRFARVAVSYRSWGFTSTDRLVAERGGRRGDFNELRERAERISDE
ncbi:MAG: FmdB family zinc ribbon protein [Frankiaceae bacterium]